MRCERPDKTTGGIILPDAERQSRPAAAARVVMVGPEVTEAEPHEIVLFDPMESLDELVIETDQYKPINLVYLRDDCVILRLSKKAALAMGIPYPNLDDMEGVRELAKLAGVIS